MRLRLAILLATLLTVTVYAQNISIVTNFFGLTASNEMDLELSTPAGIDDFDIRTSGLSSTSSLRIRDGYRQLGQAGTGKTSGPWRLETPSHGSQLLAAFGTDLLLYDPSNDDWVSIGDNPYLDTCACTNGSKVVTSLYRKNWFNPSIEAYDSLYINGVAYLINRIMGDSQIVLQSNYGATDTLPCYINTTGAAGSSTVFSTAEDDKYGFVFEDTLHVVTPQEHVKFGGAAAAVQAVKKSFTGISDWDSLTFTATFTRASDAVPAAGSYIQVSADSNYEYNIALRVVSATATSVTFRMERWHYSWLSNNPGNYWLYKEISNPTWTKIVGRTVDGVTKYDTLWYDSDAQTYIQEMVAESWGWSNLADTVNPAHRVGHYRLWRYIYKSNPIHRYVWKITSTSDVNTPENWSIDSLRYMATYFESDTGDAIGLYSREFNVEMDTVSAGVEQFVISTIGTAPGATAILDSSNWYMTSYFGNGSCGSSRKTWTSGSYHYNTGYSCFPYNVTPEWENMGLDTANYSWPSLEGPFASDTAFERFRVDSPSVYVYHSGGNYPLVCSLVVSDSIVGSTPSLELLGWPPYPSTPVLTASGAGDSFEVGDSLNIYRMARATRTPVGNGVSIQDSIAPNAWSWSYCTTAMGRLFCFGKQRRGADSDSIKGEFLDRVGWSRPFETDTFDVGDWENVYTDDGQNLSAIVIEDNTLWAGKPTSITALPMIIDQQGTSLEPSGAFPTRSRYGPISQKAVVGTPDGYYFIGWNGVYRGMSGSELISGELQWYWRDSVEQANLDRACIGYDQSRNRLFVSIPTSGSDVNNTTLVYDIATGLWVRYSFGAGEFHSASYPSNDAQLYWTNPDPAAGAIFRMEPGLTFDNAMTDIKAGGNDPIRPSLVTGWVTLDNDPTNEVTLTEWIIGGEIGSTTEIAMTVYVDSDTTASFVDTLSFSGGYAMNRVGFPIGITGNIFKFKMDAIAGDTVNVTSWGVAHVPAGKVIPR